TEPRRARRRLPGRAAVGATPNVPRPDPGSCLLWFLPVGSRLIPPGSLPGEAGFTPRTLTRPAQTTTSQGSLNTPRGLHSARDPKHPSAPQNLRVLRVSV